jgi:hypothetical protein
MVSDWKRYEHYGDENKVLADTLKEIAMMNALYLISHTPRPHTARKRDCPES